jgi:hypothetical protein
VYYCEACRAKHSWPKGYHDEPYKAHEAIKCEECGTANVPCYSNAGWRLPKPVPPPEPSPWRSYNVTALCEAMRREQDWSNLPILADALEDAGYCDAKVLGQLRGPKPENSESQRLVALLCSDETAMAVRWLERFVVWINYPDEPRMDYEYVIQQGYSGIKEDGGMFFSSDDGADFFREGAANVQEFYHNWSLATGEPLPGEERQREMYFRCAC